MTTKISIENFQSIKKADFEIDGFTVIVGKNNIGKSAVIRAIDAALTNQSGNEFIRYGEKKTKVKILKDDLDIEWEKGSTATYKVNKEVFTKLNRAIPQPLIDAGFEKMDIGNQKVSPLMASQFEALFLIHENGGTITEALASLYKIDTLSIADDLCQKTLRSQKSLLKTRDGDLKDLKGKLENYKDFEETKKEVEEILKKNDELETLKSEILQIQKMEEGLGMLTKTITNLKPITGVKIPDLKKIEKELSGMEWLRDKDNELQKLKDQLKKLKDAKTVKVPDISSINVEEIHQLQEWEKVVAESTAEIKTQQEFLDSFNLDFITKGLEDVENLMKDYSEIKDIEEPFMETATQAKSLREEFRNISDQLKEKQNELAEIKVCPTCERPL